jgi:hypothetical protein
MIFTTYKSDVHPMPGDVLAALTHIDDQNAVRMRRGERAQMNFGNHQAPECPWGI